MRPILALALLLFAIAGQAQADGYSTFNAGIAARNRDDGDEAIRLLSLAITAPDLAPRFLPVAYFDRGQIYFAGNQCDPAIADFSAGLKLKPNDFDAYLLRGLCYSIKSQFDLASADLTSAIGVRPDLSKGYVVRGIFYTDREKLDLAIADFSAAIGIEPDVPSFLVLRGNAYRRQAQYDRALEDENSVIGVNSNFSSAYFNRGLIYEDEGKFGDALDDFQNVLKLQPKDESAALNLGLTQWESGKFDDASETFAQNMKLRPQNAYTVLWLDLSRAKAGKTDGDLAERASKLDPSKWPAPVINVFLGKSTPDQAAQAAALGDAKTQQGQTCEVNFYVGEWQLLHQNAAMAKPMLEAAASSCPHEFVEWPAANAELKRLS
jgi:lipoprotein NlpI